MKNMVAIVLAGGKGTRIGAAEINKVMMKLAGKPMIGYTVALLKKVGFAKIIIVVGFKRKSIMDYLGKDLLYAEQKKPLGTAHAVKVALKKLPKGVDSVLVINADDSAFYPPEVIRKLIESHHQQKGADLTFLTVEQQNPQVARVIRDKTGKILGVVERQHLTEEQEGIKEINTGCYCFKVAFLNKYLELVPKNPLKGEYYITSLIEIGLKNQARVQAFKMSKEAYFQGVNTKEELLEADRKMQKKLKT